MKLKNWPGSKIRLLKMPSQEQRLEKRIKTVEVACAQAGSPACSPLLPFCVMAHGSEDAPQSARDARRSIREVTDDLRAFVKEPTLSYLLHMFSPDIAVALDASEADDAWNALGQINVSATILRSWPNAGIGPKKAACLRPKTQGPRRRRSRTRNYP